MLKETAVSTHGCLSLIKRVYWRLYFKLRGTSTVTPPDEVQPEYSVASEGRRPCATHHSGWFTSLVVDGQPAVAQNDVGWPRPDV